MKINIRVENKEELNQWFKDKPKQINRASRLTVNRITSDLHKRLGGIIPKTAGTSVAGYRRVRAKKTLSKVKNRSKIMRGVVWLGTMKIPAKYGGRTRNVKGGAKAGRHFFENAFVATMKSGYRGIFYRKPDGKLEQAMIDLPEAQENVIQAARWAKTAAPNYLRKQLHIALKRN